jgi:hypothetical protein
MERLNDEPKIDHAAWISPFHRILSSNLGWLWSWADNFCSRITRSFVHLGPSSYPHTPDRPTTLPIPLSPNRHTYSCCALGRFIDAMVPLMLSELFPTPCSELPPSWLQLPPLQFWLAPQFRLAPQSTKRGRCSRRRQAEEGDHAGGEGCGVEKASWPQIQILSK